MVAVEIAGEQIPAEPANVLALIEVPEAKAPQAGPGRGHTKETDSPVGKQFSGKDLRLHRIARDASGDVKDLFRAGLISDRDAAPCPCAPRWGARGW